MRRLFPQWKRQARICVLTVSLLSLPALSHAAFINVGAATVNLTEGPVTYSFLFGAPITPDLYTAATSTASVTLTSAPQATATVEISALYPSYLSGYGTLSLVPTNLGVDVGTTTCTSTNAVATTCSFGLATNNFAPAFYDGLEVLLTFQQTGLASQASWTAEVTLTTGNAPEPASVLLLGTALAGAGIRRWRKRTR